MVLFTSNVIAAICPECDQIHTQDFSVFDFSKGQKKNIICTSCGSVILILSTKNRKGFTLKLNCPLCHSEHVYNLNREKLFSQETTELFCAEAGIEVCYIGPEAEVTEYIKKQEQSVADMAEELGFVEYFENPEIMYEILEKLYALAEEGHLSCNCGKQNIQIEILPDQLELRCVSCNSYVRVKAKTQEDLEYLTSLESLKLKDVKIAVVKPIKDKKDMHNTSGNNN